MQAPARTWRWPTPRPDGVARQDFPPEEYAARRAATCHALQAAGLDWLIVIHPVCIHWLTGSEAKGYQAFQSLIVDARRDRLTMYTRESERAEMQDEAAVDALVTWGGPDGLDALAGFGALATTLGLRNGRVGMEVPAFYLHPGHEQALRSMLGEALVAQPIRLVHDLKLVKSPLELAYIRQAAAIADASMAAFADALAPDRTELELVGEIYRAILSAGGGQPATPVNFAAGPRAAYSHGAPTQRRLGAGDFGNIEYAVPYRRYMVAIGRQFAIGKPTTRMLHVYAAVRAAGEAAIAEVREEAPAREGEYVMADAILSDC